MTPIPPTRRLRSVVRTFIAGASAASLVAAFATTCATAPPPAIDGLVVAAGGRLLISDASSELVPFDGPRREVVAVTASHGRVVAVMADGGLTTSRVTAAEPLTWDRLARPAGLAAGPPLMALSPLGTELALAVGELQGARFDLMLLDLGAGTSRSIDVERGLNGPPAWIGPATIAVNVIGPAGSSEISTIDVATRGVADEVVTATVVSATADGMKIAFDDPGGDVLVGDVATWRTGSLESMTRVRARPGVAVESLALSPEGQRLAILRRAESGTPSLELLSAIDHGWSTTRIHDLTADGPISIAWVQ